MSKEIYDTGDQFAAPGTVGWANWQRSAMHNHLKATKWEAKHLVHQIRCMCESEPPAWHLMVTRAGQGFRTFEEFVTASQPWGLGYPDFPRFRAVIVAEMGNERDFDLLTAPRDSRINNRRGGKDDSSGNQKNQKGHARTSAIRAIRQAPPLVRELYTAGLLSQELAAWLREDRPERAAQVAAVLKALASVPRERKAINAAVRLAMGKRLPTLLDRVKKMIAGLDKRQRTSLMNWLAEQE